LAAEKLEKISKMKLLKKVKKSQKFMNDQYETLKSDYDELVKINKKQEKENCSLKTNFSKSEIKTEKVDALEQYGRRQNL